MQLDCNLTLEKATLIAKQSERIKKQQGTIHSKDLEVHVVRTPRKNRNETKDKNRNNKNNYKSTQNVAREKLNSCNFCGGQYHKRMDCPALKATCRNCSKIGHYFKVCRNKPKLNVVTGVHSQENFLGKVTTLEENRGQKDNWLVSLTVRNKMLTFKIDTGADVNVLPENCVNKCFPNIKLESSDKKLTGLDGKIHRTKGMFRETVKYNSKSTLATFYVVPGAETALLSGNTSEKLGLLKRLNAISDEREGEILDPAKAFPEIFEGLGKAKVKYEIQLCPDVKPYALITPRRVPIVLMGKVKVKIESMVKTGVIEPVDEPCEWCSPMVVVTKPNGDIRICVDLTKLNKFVKREFFPLPVTDYVLGQLGKAKYFSKLDANRGFWQFELEEKSQLLTTFITPFGRFKFKRLPFGITSAPEFFQKQMSQLLSGVEGVLCNVDDILVYGSTQTEHDERLKKVLEIFQDAGITLNKEKCQFRLTSLKFLGHVITKEGISPDPDKSKAINDMPPPTNVSELKSFLGMASYHRKFIDNFATIAHPLNELLKTKNSWIWDVPQQKSFEELKRKLCRAPVLAKFDPQKETIISADASSYGIGGVLKQRQPDGTIRPVAFASRTLNPAERRYAQIEKEGLSLVWACEKFQDYIMGLQVHLERIINL